MHPGKEETKAWTTAAELKELVPRLQVELELKTHVYMLVTYQDTFTASELVHYLVSEGLAIKNSDAIDIGNALVACGYIKNVVSPSALFYESETSFYAFTEKSDMLASPAPSMNAKSFRADRSIKQHTFNGDKAERPSVTEDPSS